MNDTIKLQLEHRTIRKFEQREVPKDMLDSILNVANRTACGLGLQHFSIIRVSDNGLKKKLAEAAGQLYIADMPELFVFLADLNRNKIIAAEGGENEYVNSTYALLNALSDALFAAQNVNIAVESLGMGGVYLGSVLWKIEETIKLLKLPKYTFPAIAYGFGFPAQNPALKPRMDLEFKVFENEYPDLSGIRARLKKHDEDMTKYYDLRNTDAPLDPFTKQVISMSKMLSKKVPNLGAAIKSQGFDLS